MISFSDLSSIDLNLLSFDDDILRGELVIVAKHAITLKEISVTFNNQFLKQYPTLHNPQVKKYEISRSFCVGDHFKSFVDDAIVGVKLEKGSTNRYEFAFYPDQNLVNVIMVLSKLKVGISSFVTARVTRANSAFGHASTHMARESVGEFIRKMRTQPMIRQYVPFKIHFDDVRTLKGIAYETSHIKVSLVEHITYNSRGSQIISPLQSANVTGDESQASLLDLQKHFDSSRKQLINKLVANTTSEEYQHQCDTSKVIASFDIRSDDQATDVGFSSTSQNQMKRIVGQKLVLPTVLPDIDIPGVCTITHHAKGHIVRKSQETGKEIEAEPFEVVVGVGYVDEQEERYYEAFA